MTQTSKYFYKCDNCGLCKEIDKTSWRNDDIENSILKEGWIILEDFSCHTFKKHNSSGCMPINKGEFCSKKCLFEAIKNSINKRLKYD